MASLTIFPRAWRQSNLALQIVSAMFNTVSGKKMTVLGFAYKKNTSDIRFSPAIDVCKTLIRERAALTIVDPQVASQAIKVTFGLPLQLIGMTILSLDRPRLLSIIQPVVVASCGSKSDLAHLQSHNASRRFRSRMRRGRRTTSLLSRTHTQHAQARLPGSKQDHIEAVGSHRVSNPTSKEASFQGVDKSAPRESASLHLLLSFPARRVDKPPHKKTWPPLLWFWWCLARGVVVLFAGAHALIVLTDWDEFARLDYHRIYEKMQK